MVAGAMAQASRARMLVALMDERTWKTVSDLAQIAGVAMSTATGHVNLLVDRGLLHERRVGRNRYVHLAGTHVAEVLEAVTARGEQPATPVSGLRAVSRRAALARARTCYDHLAGALGVAITDALVAQRLLDEESLVLTTAGENWLSDALELPFRPGRRTPSRACMDWTERRPHLAGAAGAHLCSVFHDRQWVRPARGSRAVTLTADGRGALHRLFGAQIDLDRDSREA